MFEGFQQFDIQTTDPLVKIRTVVGGKGPPVLLLHGNPLTHVHWHRVAPRLAENFMVVATDLRGYGDSGKPRGLADHSNYSFRRMAQPFDFPEQLLAGKEEYYIRHKLEKQGLGKGGISEETLQEYIRCWSSWAGKVTPQNSTVLMRRGRNMRVTSYAALRCHAGIIRPNRMPTAPTAN